MIIIRGKYGIFGKRLFMTKVTLHGDRICQEVINLIYDKKNEFSKEKNRTVSFDQTIEKLLKDAYIKKEKK